MFDPNAYVIWLQGLAPIILVLLVLTVLVLVSGILSGIKAKDFAWTYIADFLRTLILPKFGGWLLLKSLAFFLSIALREQCHPEQPNFQLQRCWCWRMGHTV